MHIYMIVHVTWHSSLIAHTCTITVIMW